MDMQVAADASGSEDEPWTLPEGWCWTEIENIARLRGEKVNPSDAPHLPFVGMDDIPNDGLRVLNTKPFAQMKSAGNKFKPGDVLYGRLRPYLNKTAIASMEGVASGELLAIITAINAKYFQLFLHSRGFINRAMATVSGDRPRIDFSTISEFKIPLAPLPEQRRIVERIDALFAEIADGEAALEAARKGLETFRRALLKAAVTGELTRDWRETHTPAETGHDLLARIRAERDAPSAKGRGKRVATSAPLDTSDLPDLPEGWAWALLGELLAHLTSGSRDWAEYYDRGSKVFVMAQNVRPGRFNHAYKKHVDPPDHLKDVERSRIQRDDLLITIVGANTGDVCRVDFEARDYFVCQSVALMRPTITALSEYLEMYLISPDGGRREMDKVIYGAGRPHLSFDQIEALPIPIPPPTEIAEILGRASETLGAQAEIRTMLEAQAADAARLRQAILKSAFEGTLVPQDPADEPASVMLERLRQAMTKVTSKRRGRGKAGHGG